jgi:hypothetical protein
MLERGCVQAVGWDKIDRDGGLSVSCASSGLCSPAGIAQQQTVSAPSASEAGIFIIRA